MATKRTKSLADISAQVKRLIKASATPERCTKILRICDTYRYSIMGKYCPNTYGIPDRVYYRQFSRKSYANY